MLNFLRLLQGKAANEGNVVDKLCPRQRVPYALRVAILNVFIASYSPNDIVQKYMSGEFPKSKRWVTRADGSLVSFRKHLPVYAAQIALTLAKANGLTLPPEANGDGASTSAAAASAPQLQPPPQRRQATKRTREELLDTIEESLETLYDGEDAADAAVEIVPDGDATIVVEHTVMSTEMARGWEPEYWTEEHLKTVQELARGVRPASKALQDRLYKDCRRCELSALCRHSCYRSMHNFQQPPVCPRVP